MADERVHDIIVMGKTISTTVTSHPNAVTDWINAVNPEGFRLVGFEVELYTDDENTTRIGTLQLCVGARCLVFQLLDTSRCPPSLDRFLADHNNGFVGIDIVSKLAMLKKQFPVSDFAGVNCMNLGKTAARRYKRRELIFAEQAELGSIVKVVGVAKPLVDHTNWGRPTMLGDDQVEYACIEAFLNLEIASRLLSLTQDKWDLNMELVRALCLFVGSIVFMRWYGHWMAI